MNIRFASVLWGLLMLLSIVAVFVSGSYFATNFATNGTATTQIPSLFVPVGTAVVIALIEYGRRKATSPFAEQICNGLLVLFFILLAFLVVLNAKNGIL